MKGAVVASEFAWFESINQNLRISNLNGKLDSSPALKRKSNLFLADLNLALNVFCNEQGFSTLNQKILCFLLVSRSLKL